jgi:hypothetical protein
MDVCETKLNCYREDSAEETSSIDLCSEAEHGDSYLKYAMRKRFGDG